MVLWSACEYCHIWPELSPANPASVSYIVMAYIVVAEPNVDQPLREPLPYAHVAAAELELQELVPAHLPSHQMPQARTGTGVQMWCCDACKAGPNSSVAAADFAPHRGRGDWLH